VNPRVKRKPFKEGSEEGEKSPNRKHKCTVAKPSFDNKENREEKDDGRVYLGGETGVLLKDFPRGRGPKGKRCPHEGGKRPYDSTKKWKGTGSGARGKKSLCRGRKGGGTFSGKKKADRRPAERRKVCTMRGFEKRILSLGRGDEKRKAGPCSG